MSARPKTRRVIEALLIAGLAVVLLAALELAVRAALKIASGDWPETRASRFYSEITTALELYRRHPYLHVAPREGARVEAFGRRASFNALGYRSPERPLDKPRSATRVLCSGGSTTFDILAASDETTWPWLLEGLLGAGGHPVEVWNAGFPGWTSLENLISLAIRDGDLEPDWIVLFQGINDLQPATHRPFDRQYERGHAELTYRSLGFELAPLAWHRRSLLLETLRDRLQGPQDPWEALRPAAAGAPRRPGVAPEAVAVFERNLRTFAALARSRGARLVLVPQALRVRAGHAAADRALLSQWIPGVAPDDAPAALDALNAVARRLASEGLGTLVEPAYDAWPDTSWSDPMHFSEQGSRRFAELLAEALGAEPASGR